MANPSYFICSLGMPEIKIEEGNRPFHSDNAPSLKIKFLAGRGTHISAEGCESKLELTSESRSNVEIPS